MIADPVSRSGMGFGAALTAFAIWGLLPLYWKQFSDVPAAEVLAQRILWTAFMTTVVVFLAGQHGALGRVFTDPRQRRAALLASALICANGLTFIWAVAHDRVTEVSLGYYINPLLNMFLGFVVLGERPNRLQSIAIGLAALGVTYLTLSGGQLPWPSFVLAAAFGLYGLVRKTAPVEPLVGLCAEMLIAVPFALAYLIAWPATPFGAFVTEDATMKILLVLSGVASALPLWLFSVGARRLAYTTVGVLMFVAPSLQLAVAVGIYGEPFQTMQAITFACIWTAIAVYLAGMVRQS